MFSKRNRWLILTIGIVAVCLGWHCLDNTKQGSVLADELAPLAVSESKLDFGEILPTDEPEKTIWLTNQGSEVIVIKSITSTCPCTIVESDVTALAPGESADITVSLTVSDYPSNKVDTRVQIVSEVSNTEPLNVQAHAKITPEYLVIPDAVEFGDIKLASQPTRTITLKQNGDEPVKILRVEAPDDVVADFQEVSRESTPEAFDNQKDRPAEWVVEVKPVADLLPGPLSGRVTIVTSVERIPKVKVPVRGRVRGIECTITPKVVVFGPSKPGDTVAEVRIEGSNELRVTSVRCENSALVTSTPAEQEAGAYTIQVKLPSDTAPGEKAGKLVLELTEGAARQTFTVPYFGTVASVG